MLSPTAKKRENRSTFGKVIIKGESPIFVSRGMNLAISAGLLVFLRKSSIHVATVVNDSRKEHIFCSFANGTIHNGKIRCH